VNKKKVMLIILLIIIELVIIGININEKPKAEVIKQVDVNRERNSVKVNNNLSCIYYNEKEYYQLEKEV
jgi:hypothetical protein